MPTKHSSAEKSNDAPSRHTLETVALKDGCERAMVPQALSRYQSILSLYVTKAFPV